MINVGNVEKVHTVVCSAKKAVCYICYQICRWPECAAKENELMRLQKQKANHPHSSYIPCYKNVQNEVWTIQLKVYITPVEFKDDTGANVNVINEDAFHTFSPDRTLEPLH